MPARKTYLFYLDIYLLLKIELLVWTGLLQWASRWQCPRISKHSSVPECHVPHGAGEVTLRLPLGTAIYTRKKKTGLPQTPWSDTSSRGSDFLQREMSNEL